MPVPMNGYESGELKHGDRQIRNSQVWHAALGEMALLPQQWVTENILGYLVLCPT
jgi:hypothetical protein